MDTAAVTWAKRSVAVTPTPARALRTKCAGNMCREAAKRGGDEADDDDVNGGALPRKLEKEAQCVRPAQRPGAMGEPAEQDRHGEEQMETAGR
jgi:hypothetical protein